MKFGDFRASQDGETPAAYFKAAVFKKAKAAGRTKEESMIQSFISISIGKANGDIALLNTAYNYAVTQLTAEGDLHLCTTDVFVAEAA